MSSRLVKKISSASTRDGARFDLGEIENVADEVEQVRAGAVNGAGELDLP